jgi:hypothetical protein
MGVGMYNQFSQMSQNDIGYLMANKFAPMTQVAIECVKKI